MYKRISIRLVYALSEELKDIAKKRGLSVNSLISEMAWNFVEVWRTKHELWDCENQRKEAEP